MRGRLVAVLAVVVVFAIGIPLAIGAASGTFSSALDLQASKWTTTSVSTSSTAWQTLAGLSGSVICSEGEVSATVSLQMDGAPIGLRVNVDSAPDMKPGAVRFVQAGSQDSVSFNFVINTGPFENNDNHEFSVLWRSPTGGTATIVKGTLNLLYQEGSHDCP
ncbi:MAG TPA: hypothetical protein VF986_05955 [Actinomycetota bacterium]